MIALFDALAVEHPYLTVAWHYVQKLYIKRTLMALLKNKLFVSSFARTNCFVLKRVPHIWLILTLLTLFSFQRTPGYLYVYF